MSIKHLVISGGGPILIQMIAALQELENNQYIDLTKIETIYGTSAGAMIGVMLCLKFDWETINDYIIKRPWQEVFSIKVQNILDAYSKKGIYDISIIEKCFKPLFDAKNLPLDITLEDLYKYSNIELHFFTFEINEYKIEDISYLTHPKLSVFIALQMTCGIPVLFIPVCIEDKCYIDGGVISNYPLNYCINAGKSPDEILGFKSIYSNKKVNILKDTTLIDFLLRFLYKAVFCNSLDNNQKEIKNEITFEAKYLTIDVLTNVFSNIDVRKDLFNKGIEKSKEYLENLNINLEQNATINL
jgi:predicted acylesterase/phospholipase RssA